MGSFAIELGAIIPGLFALDKAVQITAGNDVTLTPAHVQFLKVALKGGMYEHGKRKADRPILEVDPERNGLTVEELLLYYDYGARIYIGLEEWSNALDFLRIVRATLQYPHFPMHIISHES